ncbi:BQMT1 methyltransferase, partial [Atractosteus spatula]|nr:BQMT1 methyltransferase [Atractosteus spatula]
MPFAFSGILSKKLNRHLGRPAKSLTGWLLTNERMRAEIESGKVTLFNGNIMAMPLPDSSVDKVYHCNCYYYWPDLKAGTSEMHRVMKPGGLMVTTLILSSITKAASRSILLNDNWKPEVYMEALRATGFSDVRMEDKQDKNIAFQAIFATASK